MIVIPLAAGIEPLNPALRTAPPEATPSIRPTLEPTYVAWRDDAVTYVYDSLPKGTYELAYRGRAQFAGSYVQPPAIAEAMYDLSKNGRSAGARIEVAAMP